MAQPIWTSTTGSLGLFQSENNLSIQLSAAPVFPANQITYVVLAGALPSGITCSLSGLISGIPATELTVAIYSFTIRATDNLGNLRDRSFSLSISSSLAPSFISPPGLISSVLDSIWVETQIEYLNTVPENPITIRLESGTLPPGLDITTSGIIHGYPEPPLGTLTSPELTTTLIATSFSTNILTCESTAYFIVGRPIIFTGSVYGGLVAGTNYYVSSVINNTEFTISGTNNGPNFILSNGSGFGVTISLPAVETGIPIVISYAFTLQISSITGNNLRTFSMVIINQNAPSAQGGPNNSINTRVPAIYNTRPSVAPITIGDLNFGYYVFPEVGSDYYRFPPQVVADIGIIRSNNYFAFKIIGVDFDGSSITYSYANLPIGLTGDPITGWITGTPTLPLPGIIKYTFSVAVQKTNNPSIQSPFFNFSYSVSNEIDGIITWLSPDHLGTVYNGTICTKSIRATADTPLKYRLVGGALPPTLILLESGEILDYTEFQPTSSILSENDQTDFTFIIEAFSSDFPIVKSSKTFTITIVQLNTPTDTLYIQANPSINDRYILDTLLTNESLIPEELLYRPEDPNFGKATKIVYQHAFGILASNIDQYLAAIATENHYWRNITLGELATAVAKDENGEIVYEVVYSKIIDNLINPVGKSISKEIYWPQLIDLHEGPWYTSITEIYTSYEDILGQQYYTSLLPGYARILYPNSLVNMRTQVADELGLEQSTRIFPLWMSSQQEDGNTLGYTRAWVICYTKPGQSETIKNNINNNWKQPDGRFWKLNMINFKIDRFFVDKRLTYNYNNITVPPSWTGLPSGTPTPNPVNSKDFYAIFPRTTILPSETQY